jgi:hypothetical protein
MVPSEPINAEATTVTAASEGLVTTAAAAALGNARTRPSSGMTVLFTDFPSCVSPSAAL